MLNLITNKNFLRIFLTLAITILIIAPSVLIPFYLGRGARPVEIAKSTPKDKEYIDALHDAYLLEQSGDLQGALAKYRIAGKSDNPEIMQIARQGEHRTYAWLIKINSFFPDYENILGFSVKIRTPLLAVLLVVLTISLLGGIGRRRGIALRSFHVTPDMGSDVFTRLLADNITTIVRVYNSDQLGRIGVQVTMPDLVSEGTEGDIFSRAMTSLREGGLTTVSTFSISELLRFFQNLGARPEYYISGSVNIFPKQARVQAKLTKIEGGKTLAIWEASSVEIPSITPETTFMHHRVPSFLGITTRRFSNQPIQNDPRENASYLSNLSIVLASKIWHSLAQGTGAELRPSTWHTVYHFVRAMNALEGAE